MALKCYCLCWGGKNGTLVTLRIRNALRNRFQLRATASVGTISESLGKLLWRDADYGRGGNAPSFGSVICIR